MCAEETAAAELLGPTGPFVDLLDGFLPRREQQEMASAVAAVIADRDVLVCEAGTGTGKTFAYLVPALQAGLKTIVSTATKTLQDQLYHRDLPIVLEALHASVEAALLKGRQNYVCLYRLDRASASRDIETHRQPLLTRLQQWAERSDSGDLEEVRELDDDPALAFLVTSTTDNCLGQECPLFDTCFVVRARRAAVAADVVVVNHHLLFADLMLRETGFGELLPNADVIILDEAHKVPDTASTFFSRSVSAQQIANLCRDTLAAASIDAPDMPSLNHAAAGLDTAQDAFRRLFGNDPQRADWHTVRERDDVVSKLGMLGAALQELHDCLQVAAERGPALASCNERAAELCERFDVFDHRTDDEHVRWFESGRRGFTFHQTPVSIAAEFSEHLEQSTAAWILTSASLAVEARFDHFTELLGIVNAREHLWHSPFDYTSQSLLYVPSLSSEPRAPDFERELVEAALPVLESSRGRAFFLFTSYRALDICADLLGARTAFPLLVQGQAPRSVLLSQFESLDNAILLGTATFWEGVDVRGERLSCVIIDKLPFGVPDDPVTKARMAAMQLRGENPFLQLQLPAAITALKQGAGRLIRDVTDRGVLMIGDVRILQRSYGSAFINSLPPVPLTRELGDVQAFFSGR